MFSQMLSMIFHVSHNMQNVELFQIFQNLFRHRSVSCLPVSNHLCEMFFSENKVNQSTKVILDHENYAKVGWHMPTTCSWDVPSMIKYGEPMLYGKKETDQITKT